MAAADDKDPVEAVDAERSYAAFGVAFAFGTKNRAYYRRNVPLLARHDSRRSDIQRHTPHERANLPSA
jgi:hypothetical protein